MRVLSFTVAGEYYAVDVNLVQAVARKMSITPVPAAPIEISGIANVKGRVVTVINLYSLLGYDEKRDDKRGNTSVNAIVFKSDSADSEHFMALTIGKPGELITIDEKDIKVLSSTAKKEESFCVSRIAEVGKNLYRIVDIESISKKYENNYDSDTEENTIIERDTT